jgi:DNA-binding GntR family transcriptional regulator
VSTLDSFLADVVPACSESGLRALAYKAILDVIAELRIYDHSGELQVDECKLSRDLRVSRTPIREALTILEHHGFVRRRPRHGVFVVKKTRREIIEMVYACAALESMAVRLACVNATEAQIGALRTSFSAFYEADPTGEYHRYFEARWQFCRHAATLAQCAEILSMLNHLLLHLRSVHETIFRQSIDLAYLRAAYRAII